MPLLIDGDNLLGSWPGRRRSDAERRRLTFELQRFGTRNGKRTVVVFDGVQPPATHFGNDVHFAGPARDADGLILDLLRREQDRRGWIVVTSDRALGDQCRYLEARVERSDLFRKKLGHTAGQEKPQQETDVEYWLKQFGGDS